MRNLPLREKVKKAWQQQQETEKADMAQRVIYEQQFLPKKLREICGDEYEIKMNTDSQSIIAEVDGLKFISTINEPFYLTVPLDMVESLAGVRLWWQCEKCDDTEQSAIITHDYELGMELEKFNAGNSHRCKKAKI
jgi:hypothetical protein